MDPIEAQRQIEQYILTLLQPSLHDIEEFTQDVMSEAEALGAILDPYDSEFDDECLQDAIETIEEAGYRVYFGDDVFIIIDKDCPDEVFEAWSE